MKYKSSYFYANFSLTDLFKGNSYFSTLIGSNKFSNDTGSGNETNVNSAQNSLSHYSSCEIGAIQFPNLIRAEIDELKFIDGLKNAAEKLLNTSGLKIKESTTLIKSESELGFYTVYLDHDLTGRIELKGSFFDERNYRLKVNITENSKSDKKIVFTRVILKPRPPNGAYHVIPFDKDDMSAKQFYEKGLDIAREARKTLHEQLFNQYKSKEKQENIKYAEIYAWLPLSAELRTTLEGLKIKVEVPAEYDQYEKIYFLNDPAVKMYLDAEADFKVTKTITADEVSKIPAGLILSCPFIQKEE